MHGIHLSAYHAITTQRTPAFYCHKESAQGLSLCLYGTCLCMEATYPYAIKKWISELNHQLTILSGPARGHQGSSLEKNEKLNKFVKFGNMSIKHILYFM